MKMGQSRESGPNLLEKWNTKQQNKGFNIINKTKTRSILVFDTS